MAAALRRLGFDKVFDTDFSADVTIVEEATELIGRLQNGGLLPMITSCSPGWVKFAELYYPEQLGHLSSCKSPQQMLERSSRPIMPKEQYRPQGYRFGFYNALHGKEIRDRTRDQSASGFADVDIAITTRELGNMIKRAGINFASLPDEEFDNPLSDDTGAAVIFGATGGVMEAALRTANDVLSG